MGGGKSDPENPRHAALAAALSQAKTLKTTVDPRLDAMITSMRSRAWTGGTSDDFMAALTTHRSALHTATEACVHEIEVELKNTPATTPAKAK